MATSHRLINPPPRETGTPQRSEPETIEIAKDVTIEDPEADGGWRTETDVLELTMIAREDVPAMLMIELSVASRRAAEGGEYVEVLWDALTDILPPAEFARFRTWSKQVKATIRDLVWWSEQMVGRATSRPTEGQSPSPSGLPETATDNGSTGPGEPEPATLNGGSPL